MRSLSLLALTFALAVAVPAVSYGQTPEESPTPTPTQPPDPHMYQDNAMTFVAPPNAFLAGRREVPLEALGENLQPVAVWVIHPGKEDARVIQIEMEAFTAAPSDWEGQFESQTHNAVDGALIRKQGAMSLTNGMPATFVKVTSGSGFTSREEFAVVFADTQRGIVISETGRVGEISADQARKDLANAKAVQYPMNQP